MAACGHECMYECVYMYKYLLVCLHTVAIKMRSYLMHVIKAKVSNQDQVLTINYKMFSPKISLFFFSYIYVYVYRIFDGMSICLNVAAAAC